MYELEWDPYLEKNTKCGSVHWILSYRIIKNMGQFIGFLARDEYKMFFI